MEPGESPGSTLNSTGDTGQLLQELMNLQKSNASVGSLTGNLTLQESGEGVGSGEATNPTLTELMKTIHVYENSNTPRQLITLQGSDAANSFSVYGREVDIIASKPSSGVISQSTTGSNKVKITPVVKYDWEVTHYIGNLVAVHRNNVYAAYSLRGKSGGVVRVVNRRTAERVLLKEFVGKVIDISFAHTDDVIIAAVDQMGNLFVYQITEMDDGKLQTPLLLYVTRPKDTELSEYHRVIWCPFIPDDCDDSSITDSSTQDASRVLVLTQNETPIMDAAFSPDGTALATASLDGEVKFFQVNENTSPRCLHQWKPHDGKPLSCLCFLDDHKNLSPEFLCPAGLPSNFTVEPCMKSAIDLSAKYFVLSDIRRKKKIAKSYCLFQVLYVLQIHQDSSSNTAHVSSVSEFLLAQPCLSFAILDASKKKFKKSSGDDSHLDEITTGELDREDHEDTEPKTEGFTTTTSGIQIRLYTVHPKALQELLIRFKPESSAPPPPTPSVSTISHDETGIRDALSDMSMSTEHSLHDSEAQSEGSLTHPGEGTQPVLMTPDAFTASPRKQGDNSGEPVVRASGSSTSSFTHVTGLNEEFFSPRSSGDHSVVSVGSTITQTPTSKEPSPGRINGELTPGSVPLPPVTDAEESDLLTPKAKDFDQSGEVFPSPQDKNTNNVHDQLQKVCIEDLFDTQDSRKSLEVTGESTASTAGFEVNDGMKRQGPQYSYDENDEEVAEVLGTSYSDEAQQETEMQGTQPFVEQNTSVIDTSSVADDSGDQVLRAWPKPPDLSDSQRPPDEATQKSDFGDDDDEEEEEEVEGEEDVQVEEEEEVCVEGEDVTEQEDNREADASIEEQIEEHFDDSDAQDSPKEAPLHSMSRNILTLLETQRAQIERLQYQLNVQQEQQLELQRKQVETKQLHEMMQQQPQTNIEEHLGKIENIVTSRVERLFTQHAQKENQRINELLQQTDSRDRQRQEQLQREVTQRLDQSVARNIEHIVKDEMRQTIAPNISRILDPLKDQLHQELAQKLTATDSLLKDNINIHNLESHLEQVKQKQTEARDPLIAQLRKLTDTFQSSAESLQTQMMAVVQSQVSAEMQNSMAREQGASISDSVLNAMRSGAVTPVQLTPDPHQAQTHILQLLRQGQLNAAFQQALSASNLDLVMFVCETVNPSQVFNQTPCPLQQPVLLSLIQQLSADIGNNTDLKHKYLEEAVMNLDTSNTITREHIKGVLFGLTQKLKVHISEHPNDKSTRSLKMLLMASQSLLK
ncbi:hypothetical protein KUTeg_019610 [Tegillarca granosa]|uniref:Enhancer of mRNA-decapping protein 4 n=1 Tax=Tegillarca granosa TaxID=220873 RepID=A0ABQ9ED21_TEGGR|nr:hypothetical protein KUTeg_019610 [Tegillarca granosa]